MCFGPGVFFDLGTFTETTSCTYLLSDVVGLFTTPSTFDMTLAFGFFSLRWCTFTHFIPPVMGRYKLHYPL